MSYIGLMDCNNFFVSCERLFRPDLAKRPVAVLSSNDGCIVARSQEVKDLGIPMGTPYFKVKERCREKGVTLFSSNFSLYRDISSRVMRVLSDEADDVEIYSVDEAFFSISDSVTEEELHHLREDIMRTVGIPVSIGAASTKTIAKEASHIAKKGSGVSILTERAWDDVMKHTPCSSVWGIGRKTSEKLRTYGIETVFDLVSCDTSFIRSNFGVHGERMLYELQGIPLYDTTDNTGDLQGSIMSSRSFGSEIRSLGDLESAVAYHIEHVAEKLRKQRCLASKLYVSVRPSRFGDYALRARSREIELTTPTDQTGILLSHALYATREMFESDVPYKKAGVTVGGLVPKAYASASLFSHQNGDGGSNEEGIDPLVDEINDRFGPRTIHNAAIRDHRIWRSNAMLRSPHYTTKWTELSRVKAI